MHEKRNATIDVLKGLAILMVILGHTIDGSTIDGKSTIIWNVIWTLQMPLFILISGYVMKYGEQCNDREDFLRFIKKRTVSLLLPWVIWTFLIRGLISGNSSFLNLRYILNNMDSGYWFLFSLWTIQMIFACSQYVTGKAKKRKFAGLMLLTAVYIVGGGSAPISRRTNTHVIFGDKTDTLLYDFLVLGLSIRKV